MISIISGFKVRGLATALSLALLLSFSLNTAYGETSNDLREILGMTPNSYGTTIGIGDGLKDEPKEDANDNNGYAITDEDEQSNKIIHNIQNNVDVSSLEGEIDQLETRLKSRLENTSSAYLIVTTVDDLVNLQNKLYRALNNNNNGYASDSLVVVDKPTYSDEAAEEDAETLRVISEAGVETAIVADINSLDYIIGDIGSRAHSVVSTTFRIVTPYGFTKHASEEKFTSSKLLGIELLAPEGTEIVSQWNGVVVGTYNDLASGAQTIKIYHGNSTYTVYSHVRAVKGVYVGATVRTGEVIAVAANTKDAEPTKDNHILYQIKLNGEFINPLTIYGSRGKTLYERWLTSNAYDNVVEAGESYYNDLDESFRYEHDTSEDPPAVIFPDYNKEYITDDAEHEPYDGVEEPIWSLEDLMGS